VLNSLYHSVIWPVVATDKFVFRLDLRNVFMLQKALLSPEAKFKHRVKEITRYTETKPFSSSLLDRVSVANLWSNYEIQVSLVLVKTGSETLLHNVSENFSFHVCTFHPTSESLVTAAIHGNLLRDCEFRENRHSENHVLLRGANECLSASSTFINRYSVVGIVTMLRA
jgi:hypothetical protein